MLHLSLVDPAWGASDFPTQSPNFFILVASEDVAIEAHRGLSSRWLEIIVSILHFLPYLLLHLLSLDVSSKRILFLLVTVFVAHNVFENVHLLLYFCCSWWTCFRVKRRYFTCCCSCCHIGIALVDLGGVSGARPPKGLDSFVSTYTIFKMQPPRDSTPPHKVHAPPYGKSWIYNCIGYQRGA